MSSFILQYSPIQILVDPTKVTIPYTQIKSRVEVTSEVELFPYIKEHTKDPLGKIQTFVSFLENVWYDEAAIQYVKPAASYQTFSR